MEVNEGRKEVGELVVEEQKRWRSGSRRWGNMAGELFSGV